MLRDETVALQLPPARARWSSAASADRGRAADERSSAFDAECAAARLARGEEMTRAAVRDPLTVRPASDRPSVATAIAGADRLRHVASASIRSAVLLWLASLFVPAIGVGGVDEGDAGVERGMKDNRWRAPRRGPLGRQAHRRPRRSRPVRDRRRGWAALQQRTRHAAGRAAGRRVSAHCSPSRAMSEPRWRPSNSRNA